MDQIIDMLANSKLAVNNFVEPGSRESARSPFKNMGYEEGDQDDGLYDLNVVFILNNYNEDDREEGNKAFFPPPNIFSLIF